MASTLRLELPDRPLVRPDGRLSEDLRRFLLTLGEVATSLGDLDGTTDDLAEGSENLFARPTFESVSKNISSWEATFDYTTGSLSTITYQNGPLEVVKTFGYTGGVLTSITLSGDVPGGIPLTKTLLYSGSDLVGFEYS